MLQVAGVSKNQRLDVPFRCIIKTTKQPFMKALKFTMMAALASLLLHVAPSHAQSIYLGPKIGINFDQVKGKSLDEAFKGNFLGGAFVGVKFTAVRIQGEVLFTTGKVETDNTASDSTYRNQTFKTTQISVPITVGFNIVPKLLWLYAGPQFTGIVSISNPSDFYHGTEDVIKKGYVSGVVGADLQLPFRINAGVRYAFGLSDINNIGDAYGSWKSSQLQIHAGITLFSFP